METVKLPWQSIGHLLQDAAARVPDRTLLVFEGKAISYRDANARVNRIANALTGLGLARGDRVAVMMPNGIDFPLIWLALAKTGLVLVPVNTEYQQHDLQYVLTDSGAAAAIVHSEYLRRVDAIRGNLQALRHLLVAGAASESSFERAVDTASDRYTIVDVDDSMLLNIQYTSGTTGFPKGCMLTHRYWMLVAHYGKNALQLRPDDVHFNAQPFYYMDGMWNLVLCLMAEISLVLVKRFSVSSFWQTIVENGVTFFYCLGTMPVMLMNREPDAFERTHKVRAVSCSGIVPQMHAQFEARFGCPWREGYGTTESGTETFVPFADVACVGTGTLGVPLPSKEARIIDPSGKALKAGEIGEYISRGEPIMLGYWNNPQATAETIRDGWFHSGDLGYLDERGQFHIVGRTKDMVRRGGENISAAEVEGVLVGHDKVRLAAVIAVPDPVRGEEAKAFIVLRDGETRDTAPPQSILNYAKSRLAAFKVPRYIEYVASLPMTPSERIEKHKLAKSRSDQRSGSYDATVQKWLP